MKAKEVHLNFDPSTGEVTTEPVQTEETTEETTEQTEETTEETTQQEETTEETTEQTEEETTEETTEETAEQTEEVTEPVLTDEAVLKYISEKTGNTFSDFDGLSKAETPELPSEVQKYLEFKKDTGRGFDDFVKANRDIDSLNDEDILIEYTIRENEGFDVNDALEHLDDMFGYEEDVPEKEKSKRDRLEKSYLAKAKKVLREEAEKYKVPVESTDTPAEIPDEYKQAFEFKSKYDENQTLTDTKNADIRKKFEQETNKLFSDDFKGFELKIGDDVVETYKPSNVEDVKKANLDLGKALGKFFHEDGSIKDVQGYHKALTAAFDPDAMASYFYEKGKNDAIAGNIDKDKPETRQTNTGNPTTRNTGFAKSVDVDNSQPTKKTSFGTKFKMKHYR